MKSAAACLLLVPTLGSAAPFDGTWVTEKDSVKLVGKPDHYRLAGGMFTCGPCTPSYTVKADGTPQPLKGHPYYDKVIVKVIDASTTEVKTYAGDKMFGERRLSVSADGNTLTDDFTSYMGPTPAKGTSVSKRMGAAPAGAASISGAWKSDMTDSSFPSEFLTVTYTETANGLKMSSPTGQSYDAGFDGKPAFTEGDTGKTMVSLKRLDAHTIRETDTRGGQVTDQLTLKVSADGKTLHGVDRDPVHGTIMTFTADRQ